MSKKDEALKLALEPVMSVYITKDGIEDWWHKLPEGRHELGDITAIRVALASKSEALAEQPAQNEPAYQYLLGQNSQMTAELAKFRAVSAQALEALEECRRDPRLKYEHPYYDKTITAIREALTEQPRLLSAAPCDQCGYNGPGYYQPDTHQCAAKHHKALAEQPAQQEVDWEKLYRLEVKKKEALAAKYERDTGKKLTRIVPMAEQPAQQQDHDCALKRGGIVCRHCDLEIVEASDAPQIARQQDIPDLIAGALGVSRGTAYDMMREVLAGAQQQPTVEDNSQNWLGMDGTTAYWLIQRHADGWPDAGKMMTEWLEANQTQPAQQQEPVAKLGMYEHRCPSVTGHRGPSFVCQKAKHGVNQNSYCKDCTCPEALNTSPPASKPWVGLTDEERNDMINAAYDDHYNRRVSDTDLEIAKAVEFKLREKNA